MTDDLFGDVFASAEAALNPEQVTTVALNKIYSDDQVRKVFANIPELAASILENGQTTPIVVHPADENGNHLIFNGGRREKAFEFLLEQGHELLVDIFINNNCGTIEHNGVVIPDLKTKVGMISDNVQRDDLRPSEIANDIKELLSEPYKQSPKDIAKLMGKSPTWVSRYSKYINRTPEIEAVEKSGITDGELLYNLVRIHEKSPELLIQLLENSDNYALLTRQLTKQVLDEAKKPTQVQSLLSNEATPSLAKNAYFEQKITTDDAMIVIDRFNATHFDAVAKTVESIKPKAKIDADTLTTMIENNIFIERIESGEFNHLSAAIIDALHLQVITSENALEWAVKLYNVSDETFNVLIQDGEEKLTYVFERAFYEVESKAKSDTLNTHQNVDFIAVFDDLSFTVSDSMLEVCPQNLSMAFGIVLDEEANAQVDEMKLISSIIGRIEAIGINAVESFTERAKAITFVKESLPLPSTTAKSKAKKQSAKKAEITSNVNEDSSSPDDNLPIDFINGELSIGSFSSLLNKDETRALISKMTKWLAQD